jgi:hypothetical protein
VQASCVAATGALSTQLRLPLEGLPNWKHNPVEEIGDFCRSCSKPRALPVHPWSKQRGFKRGQSADAQFVSRRFSGSSIFDDIEIDLLPLVEGAQPGTLDRTDMDKDILAAVGGLNKAKAFLAIEPLYSARTHESFLSLATRAHWHAKHRCLFPRLFDFGKMLKRARPS